MGRLSDRLARLKAQADERERVTVVTIAGGKGVSPTLILVGGNVASRRRAEEDWYERHPQARRPVRARQQGVPIVDAATPQEGGTSTRQASGRAATAGAGRPRSNSRLGTRSTPGSPKTGRRLPQGGELFGASHGVPKIRTAP
jgi:hypothetical protein